MPLIADRGLKTVAGWYGQGLRRYIVDCDHATTELILRRDDDSDDARVIADLIDDHRINYAASPSGLDELCGCQPVTRVVH